MDQQGCTVVRRADERDIDDIVRVLAQAFETGDPIEEYVFPDRVQRYRRTPDMLRVLVRHRFLPVDGAMVATVDGRVVGAALWRPPGTRTAWWREMLAGPQLLAAMGAATVRGMAVDAAIAEVAPAQPHMFLVYLGCEPGLQRRGVGRALWSALAEQADADSAALGGICKDGNVAYYEALGCEVVRRVRIGRDGPEMNLVLRQPAS
ncbi:MAG TPA: GNAT family N-acetyltransferase [Nocardia sp.]|uniref:GNAT family N-acetyltransferase n=1 Tax=Nocardia sp. TaxID=1821 RepID=UPI002B4B43EE|nr:GNAT family N-acetyltransferase [Nocardia sp.]HLS77114.1 GNAT family N-acetyltransferase [Nocardia sp.]